MFYLEHLLNIFIKNPFRFLAFLFSSILLVQIILNPESLLSFLKIKEDVKNPYFNALVKSDENIEDLARKLRELPSIDRVSTISQKKISSELNKTLSKISPDSADLKDSLSNDLKLKGLKVFFKKGASEKAQDLTMEYLGRLIGKEKITLSKIFNKRNEKNAKKTKENKSLVKKEYLYGLFFGVWIICSILFFKTFAQYTYLLEKYQRASLVRLKLFVCLALLILVPLFVYNFYIFGPSLFRYLIVLALFFLLGGISMFKKGWA